MPDHSDFDLCHLGDVPLVERRAHGGEGHVLFHRLIDRTGRGEALHFVDLAHIPVGSSVGLHRHASSEEEFYLVLRGTGRLRRRQNTVSLNAQT